MRLDLDRSRYVLRTRAKGLLSALAHALELEGRFASGEAKEDGGTWSGRAKVRPADLRVVGVLHKDKLDTTVLSASDVREIERRMRDDTLKGATEVEIVARSTDDLEIVLAGRTSKLRLSPRVAGDAVTARGTLSMKALGLAEIKGPLGAFTVKDEIEVEVQAWLLPD